MSDRKDMAIELGQKIYSNTIESLQKENDILKTTVKELGEKILLAVSSEAFKDNDPKTWALLRNLSESKGFSDNVLSILADE